MDRNRVKQIIYGIGFIVFSGIILIGGYFLFFSKPAACFDNKQNSNETGIDCGGLCISCQIKYAQPISVNWVKALPAGNKISLVAEIKNSNLNAGSDDFSYNLNIYDKTENKVQTISGQSFIYAGEVKYIVQVLDFNYQDFSRTEMEFSQTDWQLKENFKKPNVFAKDFKTNVYNPQKIQFPLYTFTRDLYSGIKGEDVFALQDFLKANNFYTASSTGVYDAKTKNAVIAFQKDKQISPANGYFNKAARDLINAQIEEIKKTISQTAEIYPVTITGIIKNNDIIKASKVIITGLIFDNMGLIAGVSKTELENIEPTDEKEFAIIFPENIDVTRIDSSKTKIYVDSLR